MEPTREAKLKASIQVFARQTKLKTRTRTALHFDAAFATVEDLISRSVKDMRARKNFGEATIAEIQGALRANGLDFYEEDEEERIFVPADHG